MQCLINPWNVIVNKTGVTIIGWSTNGRLPMTAVLTVEDIGVVPLAAICTFTVLLALSIALVRSVPRPHDLCVRGKTLLCWHILAFSTWQSPYQITAWEEHVHKENLEWFSKAAGTFPSMSVRSMHFCNMFQITEQDSPKKATKHS